MRSPCHSHPRRVIPYRGEKLPRSFRAAFTLVEVVLAIGIVSFAIMTMMGTMAVGLTVVRDASDNTMHAQIIGQVTSTLTQTPFAEVENFVKDHDVWYFDREGKQVPVEGESIYRATLTFAAGGSGTYPGAPSSLQKSASAVAVTVTTRPPGAANAAATTKTQVIIPNS